MKDLGFSNILVSNNYRSNDLWINIDSDNGKQVFFGSLDYKFDMDILNSIGENVYYKPHPSFANISSTKNWKEPHEGIYPIVYSQSMISKNLLNNRSNFKVIFKKNHQMSILDIKSFLEDNNLSCSNIFGDYFLTEISFNK